MADFKKVMAKDQYKTSAVFNILETNNWKLQKRNSIYSSNQNPANTQGLSLFRPLKQTPTDSIA